jgi:hypothetical protein
MFVLPHAWYAQRVLMDDSRATDLPSRWIEPGEQVSAAVGNSIISGSKTGTPHWRQIRLV